MGLDITVERFVTKPVDEDQCYKLWEMNNSGGIELNNFDFPEWVLAKKSTRKFTVNDWAKYKEQTGHDVLNDYGMRMMGPVCKGETEDDEKYGYVLEANKDGIEPKELVICIDDVPQYETELPVVFYKEVGYQRKGLNSQFYQDYSDGKIGYYVWTKDELERYLKDYVEDDMKDYFKKNIVDVFEDGKDVCTFDW
jgi:hypothetical protein